MSDLPAEALAPASPDPGLLGEAYRRGILPPQQRGMYEEALKRGLLKPQQAQTSPPSAPTAGPPDQSLHLNEALAPRVPKGAARPFAPGEWVDNPDRSWSSEKTVTVINPAINGGKPTVLPSLWLKDGKPYTAKDEDEAAALAKASGLSFRGYHSLEEAEKFATEREAQWQKMRPADARSVSPLWESAPTDTVPGLRPLVPEIVNPQGAMGSAIAKAPAALRAAQESFAARQKRATEERRLAEGYEPGVDYDTGTGWTDAVALMRSDNPEEKRTYLASKYGKENVFQDKRGEFFVQTPEGKRVSPEGTGFVNNFVAGLYADAPMIAGATMGAAAGAPAGPMGAVAGAGIGGAAGKAAIEALKVLTGQQRQTLGQEVAGLGRAGAAMAAGEGLGRLVTGIPGAAGRLFRGNVTGTTPEMRELAGSVERAGGVAPLRSVTPGLSSAIQKQDISARLGADWLEDRNRAAVHQRLQDILASTGMAPAEREAAFQQILDPTARVSAREAGEPIVGAIRQQAAAYEAEVNRLGAEADRQLTAQLSRLNALSRRSPAGLLGEDVAAGIGQARSDFSTAMQKVYAKVDEAIAPAMKTPPDQYLPGYEPRPGYLGILVATPKVTGVVPTGLIKREAKKVLDEIPKDAQGSPIFGDARVLKTLQQLQNLHPKIPLADAQRIRATLGDFGEFTDLTPGVAKRQFDSLRQSVNVAMKVAESDPAVAPAINLLRKADAAYAKGIAKFEDATINQIVNQARTRVVPDPGAVADKILQPKFTARAREIKQMVGERVWRRVAAADWDNVVNVARDPQTGEVAARKIAAAIKARDRNGLLELTYGPSIAQDMRVYSQRLDARGGKIDAARLSPDNFGRVMREYEKAAAQRDAFLSENYLSALAKPGPTADDAVSFVLKPGQEARLMEAQQHFGDQSPQMTNIRNQALKELLNSAIIRTETGAGTTVEGEGIEKALRRFTPRQQEILFPGGLADDMRRLAQEIRFMFPAKHDQLGGALIAGMVKNIPLPARLLPLAYYEGTAWVFSQPAVVRALANGLRPGPGQAATRETIRMLFRAAAAGQLPQEKTPAAPGVMSGPEAIGRQLIGEKLPAPAAAAPVPRAPVVPVEDDGGDTIEPPPRQPRHSVGGP